MSTDAEQYKNDMFKIYEGGHPLGEQKKQIPEKRVTASCYLRHRARWTDEELLAVIYASPPTTNDELAQALQREPGSIHSIKCFTRGALLRPGKYLQPKYREPRLAIRWQIANVLLSIGVLNWSEDQIKERAKTLPGTKTRNARNAEYLARNT